MDSDKVVEAIQTSHEKLQGKLTLLDTKLTILEQKLDQRLPPKKTEENLNKKDLLVILFFFLTTVAAVLEYSSTGQVGRSLGWLWLMGFIIVGGLVLDILF